MNEHTGKTLGHILAFITIIVWGATFIASKLLLQEFTPIQLMIMRFVLGYIILFIMKPKIKINSFKEELGFLLLGIFGVTLYFYFENVALTYTITSNVSIIVAAAPIITAVLAHYFTHDEKIDRSIIYGFIIAMLGVSLVVFNGKVILKLNPLGDVLSLLAAFSWGIYSIMLKKYLCRYGSIILARKTLFYGIITTMPLVIYERNHFDFEAFTSPTLLISLIFLAFLGSGICYLTWNMATKILGVVATNNYIYLIPFVTMLTAGIILKEKITIMGLFGAILIISGVFISSLKRK